MEPLLIAGLGNPGDEYANTRHNAGSDFINLICSKYSLELKKENQIHGSFALYEAGDLKLIFVSPSTYMNESGLCISKSKKFFGLESNQILIAHDELDLPNAEIKLKDSGGHGGHNGLRSITQSLGSDAYHRIRIGIGRPDPGRDVSSFVLGKPSAKERLIIFSRIDDVLALSDEIMSGSFEGAMNVLNRRDDN